MVNWNLVEHCKRKIDLSEFLDFLYNNRKQKIFCPFHEDVNKKSAVYYPDDNVIYCFTERETYGPYDYFREIEGMSENEIKEFTDYQGQEYEREKNEIPDSVVHDLNDLKKKMVDKGSVSSYIGSVLFLLVDKESFFESQKLREKEWH